MKLRLPDRGPVDYQVVRDNSQWQDHVLRVAVTASLISWLHPVTIVDPACGDGSVVAAAHAIAPIEGAFLSDISRPNFYRVGTELRPRFPENLRVACGTIEEALDDPFQFDVAVLTEILEHVEDPVAILRLARQRATYLVASSPVYPNDGVIYDTNPEHLWQFSAKAFEEMLEESGWDGFVYVPIYITKNEYDFQIWIAR